MPGILSLKKQAHYDEKKQNKGEPTAIVTTIRNAEVRTRKAIVGGVILTLNICCPGIREYTR